jgi:hypothetical protein
MLGKNLDDIILIKIILKFVNTVLNKLIYYIELQETFALLFFSVTNIKLINKNK